MKILYDSWIFGQRYGGISRYFSELIPRIAKIHGCDVSVNMGLYANRYGVEKHRDSFSHFAGIPRPWIRRSHLISQAISNLWFRRFALRVRPDVYHTTSYFEARSFNIKACRILTLHDLIQHRAPGFEHFPEANRMLVERAIREADGIICISKATQRDLLELFAIGDKPVAVIYHGRPAKKYSIPANTLEKPYLLFIGMRHGYKNFGILARAFARVSMLLRDHRLVLVGGESLTLMEVELLNELKVYGKTIHIQEANEQMLASLYTDADMLIYPSLYEGFGLPLLEAFTYDCPVISSNSSCLPEIGGTAAIYFEPSDENELFDAIIRLYRDKPLREQLIMAGRSRVKDFDWDKCAVETAGFYQRVLQKKGY